MQFTNSLVVRIEQMMEVKGSVLYVKRLDEIHPMISGNKWWKLKYNLHEAKLQNQQVVTFGGAFSNHLVATAAACNEMRLNCIGIVRGERIEPLNPSLASAESNGMKLKFVSRDGYRNKESEVYIQELKNELGDFYLVPEGGTNAMAIKGVSEMLTEEDKSFDFICCPIGTGGTMTGILKSVSSRTTVLGFPVLKSGYSIEDLINKYGIKARKKWKVFEDYHFGGYAKFNPKLIAFINEFPIPLDPVYTGKMFYGIVDLLNNGYFNKGSKILALHTGGLQGVAGFNQRFGNLVTNLPEQI